MESQSLKSAIGRFAAAHVLCVGDVLLDRYVYGDVDRISPEAPVPVLRVRREEEMLGGVGNVARNVVALNAQAEVLSVLGDDAIGRRTIELVGELRNGAAVDSRCRGIRESSDRSLATSATGCSDRSLATSATGCSDRSLATSATGRQTMPLVEAGRVSIEKTRCLTGRQQIVRLDREVVAPISDASMHELLQRFGALIGESTAVVISDYAKGVLRPELLERLIAVAREHGKPVIVDPKGSDYARYRGANVVTPNRQELGLATGLPVSTAEQVSAASEWLLERFEFEAVIATLGRDGMMVTWRGGDFFGSRIRENSSSCGTFGSLTTSATEKSTARRNATVGDSRLLSATAREVYDVSGAGDTVTACLAVGLSVGLPLIEAAELANAAAGLVVEKIGTAVVTTDELLRFCQLAQFRESEPKIKSWPEVRDLACDWRATGLTVGFTNGCFDLLHPGHVQMLSQARRLCDRLIVGLNSDESVRRLKGPQRPVQNELARAVILGALACVDAVVLFEQDAPSELVEVIRPDVMIKGKDYRVEQIAGASFVLKHGGRVELIDLVPEQSTTRLIAKGLA